MENLFRPIPISLIILLSAILVGIIIFMWLFGRFAIFIVKEDNLKKQLKFYIPVIQNIISIAYIVYATYRLFPYQAFFVSLIIILMLLINWKMVQNFIQGTIYRLVSGNIIGANVQIGNHSGKIISMRNLSLSIQDSSGKIIQVPYIKLNDTIILKSNEEKSTEVQNLTIKLQNSNIPDDVLTGKTMEKLISFPWIIAHQTIETSIVKKDSENTYIKISYTLEEEEKAKFINNELELFLNELIENYL